MRRAAIVLLIVIGAFRIAATYKVFSETADEPMHLLAGLEVLTNHAYGAQLQNPPLPRIAIALGPWLAGARYPSSLHSWSDLLAIFYSTGHYETMLVLA